MKLQKLKSAFTLIELLVVITIIGILATWAVNVYTSQIQKARDSTRLTDVNALRTWLEQTYQDKWAYPNAWLATSSLPSFATVTWYVPKLPNDPKTWQKAATVNFDYTYAVAADANAIVWQIFEVSSTFENGWNLTEKAAKDGWTDNLRVELGISLATVTTPINIAVASVPATWINTWVPVAASCLAISWTAAATCPTAESTTTNGNWILVIR